MIEIFKTINGKLTEIDKPEKNSWINISMPTNEEIERLRTIANIPNNIIDSIKDTNEVPTIEEYDNNIFVLIRIPKQKQASTEYSTVPLGIIGTKDYLITISFFENETIDNLKDKKIDTSKSRSCGLKILLSSSEIYMNYLSEISKKIYLLRKDINSSMKNTQLTKLLDIEKSLIYFDTSLESNKKLLEKMTRAKLFNKTHLKLLERVIEEYNQAIEMNKIYSNILVRMMDSFSSIISNNLNATMRSLTSITIILMIPTLISSLYGMNIDLPFQNDPTAFLLLIVLSILLSIIGIIIFWKTDLL